MSKSLTGNCFAVDVKVVLNFHVIRSWINLFGMRKYEKFSYCRSNDTPNFICNLISNINYLLRDLADSCRCCEGAGSKWKCVRDTGHIQTERRIVCKIAEEIKKEN